MPKEVTAARLQMIDAASVNRRCETRERLRERWQQLRHQTRQGRDSWKAGEGRMEEPKWVQLAAWEQERSALPPSPGSGRGSRGGAGESRLWGDRAEGGCGAGRPLLLGHCGEVPFMPR